MQLSILNSRQHSILIAMFWSSYLPPIGDNQNKFAGMVQSSLCCLKFIICMFVNHSAHMTRYPKCIWLDLWSGGRRFSVWSSLHWWKNWTVTSLTGVEKIYYTDLSIIFQISFPSFTIVSFLRSLLSEFSFETGKDILGFDFQWT